jgi:hypothetical protein
MNALAGLDFMGGGGGGGGYGGSDSGSATATSTNTFGPFMVGRGAGGGVPTWALIGGGLLLAVLLLKGR